MVSRATFVAGALALFVLASLPIPWTHWRETRSLTTRRQTELMVVPVAARFPAPARPLAAACDALQAWLIPRGVCARHQEHKAFFELQRSNYPSRAQGAQIGWGQRVVMAVGAVGVPGWVFPEVAVIDTLGLNDRVVARNPGLRWGERHMAHDRVPAPGYVECFRPNLDLRPGGQLFVRRFRVLSDDEIRQCEARKW